MFDTASTAAPLRTLTPERTPDELEREFVECESLIAQLRAVQMQMVSQLDTMQVPLGDGCRTTAEWVASRADMAPETASALVRLSRDPAVHRELASGAVTFGRAAATALLAATDASDHAIETSRGLDITGVRRLAAKWRRVTRVAECDAFERRQIAIQPTLDNAMWQGWFRLPGVDGKLLEEALSRRADEFPGDRDASRRQRMADALVAIAQDALDPDTEDRAATGGSNRTQLLTLFGDADMLATTGNEAGVEIPSGPRAGIGALEELICSGSVEWIRRAADGRPLGVGRRSRVIPPALRRFVLARDGGCVADGCRSRYRLQAHHVTPWSRGGRTESDNLVTVCWYHHHVVIHGRGQGIDPESSRRRVRFLPRSRAGPHRGPRR